MNEVIYKQALLDAIAIKAKEKMADVNHNYMRGMHETAMVVESMEPADPWEWHKTFDDDPETFPDTERIVLVSFQNVGFLQLGRWRMNRYTGCGNWYLADEEETFLEYDLYVDGWWELPTKPEDVA